MSEELKVSEETKVALDEIKKKEADQKEHEEVCKKLAEYVPGVDWSPLPLSDAKKVKEKWEAEISKRKFASPRVSREDQSEYNKSNLKIAKHTTELNKDQMARNHYIQSLGEAHQMDVAPAIWKNCLVPASIVEKLDKGEELDAYEQSLMEEKHPLEDYERRNLERANYGIAKTQNKLVEAGLELQTLLQKFIETYKYDGPLPIEIDQDGHFKHTPADQQQGPVARRGR